MFPPDPRKGSLFVSVLVFLSFYLAFGERLPLSARSQMGECGYAHAGRNSYLTFCKFLYKTRP
jgi:hypothetical protein